MEADESTARIISFTDTQNSSAKLVLEREMAVLQFEAVLLLEQTHVPSCRELAATWLPRESTIEAAAPFTTSRPKPTHAMKVKWRIGIMMQPLLTLDAHKQNQVLLARRRLSANKPCRD
mmetsp:Transcript_116561/g.291074  ORF Transcript_116561/g.291074 Transcript_116561/m.291074 type:complete len:119 (+) Transcript_116561:188-544(+)